MTSAYLFHNQLYSGLCLNIFLPKISVWRDLQFQGNSTFFWSLVDSACRVQKHQRFSGLSWTLQSPEILILQIELSFLLPQPNHIRNVEIYFQLTQHVSGLSWTLHSPETLILQIELYLLLPQPNHVRNVEIYFISLNLFLVSAGHCRVQKTLILQIELSLLLPQPNHVRNVEIYFQFT